MAIGTHTHTHTHFLSYKIGSFWCKAFSFSGGWSFRLFHVKIWGTLSHWTFPRHRFIASRPSFGPLNEATSDSILLRFRMDFQKKNRCNLFKIIQQKSGKAVKETVINAWPCLAMKLVTIFYSHHPDDCPPLRLGGV